MRYDTLKEFKGRRYTGMAVGGRHTWIYPNGLWKERKVAPDRWEFTLSAVKERETPAPDGSGAPIDTRFHWYILAHQSVRKIDSNAYTTHMSGVKYKLAHKRADRDQWNTAYGRGPSERGRLICILKEALADLKGRGPPKRIASLADF